MRRKFGYMAAAFLVVAFVVLRLSLCLAETKEGGMDKLREEIKASSQKNDHASVIKLGEQYIKSDPGNIEVLVTLTESYLSSKEYFAKADEAIKKALAAGPNNTWVLKTAAKSKRIQAEQSKTSAEKQKLLDSAQETIDTLLKAAPDDAWINSEAALIYLAQGKKNEATKAIKKAINAQPNDPYIKNIAAKIDTTP